MVCEKCNYKGSTKFTVYKGKLLCFLCVSGIEVELLPEGTQLYLFHIEDDV